MITTTAGIGSPISASTVRKSVVARHWSAPAHRWRAHFGQPSGTRTSAPHQSHCLASLYSHWSCCSSRPKNGNELCKPSIIRVARRTITVGLDPFRMLRQQIAMQLFLQISIRSNPAPVRPQLSRASSCRPCIHGNTLGFGAPTRYGALERFIGAPSVGLRAPSFG